MQTSDVEPFDHAGELGRAIGVDKQLGFSLGKPSLELLVLLHHVWASLRIDQEGVFIGDLIELALFGR